MDIWHDGILYQKCLDGVTMFIWQVPAGIFLPVIAIGACLGRAVGLLTYVSQCFLLLN
jgi:H+/Cl- antiporter ClcA